MTTNPESHTSVPTPPAPECRAPLLSEIPVRIWLAGIIAGNMSVRLLNQPPDRPDLVAKELHRVIDIAVTAADEILLRMHRPS